MFGDLLIIFALILINGIFAGAEIAVLSLRRTRITELVERGSTSARALQWLRDHPERFLATVQIGITVVGASAAAYGQGSLARQLADGLWRLGLGDASDEVAFGLVVAIVSFLSLVVGELVPKSLALRYSQGYSLVVGRPLLGLAGLMRPLVWLLTASSNLVLRLFGDRTTFSEARHSPEELQQLVEESAKAGALDPWVGDIASRAFDFSGLNVAEVMVPANEMVALRRHASADDVQRVLLEHGHARMPVYENTVDNIVGYVVAKDLLGMAWERQLIVLEDLMRPAYFVAESMRAIDVLKELQRRHTHMAVVVDESSGVVGLVTIEDLVEELVGEIFSEHEVRKEIAVREPGGTWLVQGSASIRDVNRVLDFDLPDGDGYSTIAGLCIHVARLIPKVGVRLAVGERTVLEVVDATPRRVRSVRVHRLPAPPDS